MPKRYLVIDTETTGLDPARDLLLEVCLLKIEDGAITGRFDATIHRPRVGGDPEALIMHAGNGLLRECANEDTSIPAEDAKDAMATWLHQHFGSDEEPIPVAGKNVWKLDLPMIGVDLKINLDRFHHRAIDPACKLMRSDEDVPPGLMECARRVGLADAKDDHRAATGAMLVFAVIEAAWKQEGN